MSNSQLRQKIPTLLSDHPLSNQSDSEAVDYQKSSYQYLISQIKIKSSALAKASNLIEILQLELQVQKSSRNEAVFTAQQQIKDAYEIQIASLTSKIDMLESIAQKRNVSMVFNSLKNTHQHKSKQDSRVLIKSCSKSLSRSKSKDNKNFILPSRKEDLDSELSFELKIYRKIILQNSLWEGNFIQEFENIETIQEPDIANGIQSMEQIEQQIKHILYSGVENPRKVSSFGRVEELLALVQQQNNIIEDMKIYQSQLQEMMKGLVHKINALLQQRCRKYATQPVKQNWNDVIGEVLEAANRWRQIKTNREQRLESQNKELRQIVEEMITLMNKKKQSAKDYRSLAN